MERGVTLVSPENTWIEFGAVIGQDTVLEPFTWIGAGANIPAGIARAEPVASLPGRGTVPVKWLHGESRSSGSDARSSRHSALLPLAVHDRPIAAFPLRSFHESSRRAEDFCGQLQRRVHRGGVPAHRHSGRQGVAWISFPDGELMVKLDEDVRGRDCFVVQSTCRPVNENLMELLIWIDCLRRASAQRITAVMPYFGYARQDRKAEGRTPITAKLVANLMTAAGADRVLAMDLHAAAGAGVLRHSDGSSAGQPGVARSTFRRSAGDGQSGDRVAGPGQPEGGLVLRRAVRTRIWRSSTSGGSRRRRWR